MVDLDRVQRYWVLEDSGGVLCVTRTPRTRSWWVLNASLGVMLFIVTAVLAYAVSRGQPTPGTPAWVPPIAVAVFAVPFLMHSLRLGLNRWVYGSLLAETGCLDQVITVFGFRYRRRLI